mmetsp:Transcript_3209/g.9317  ORF Transcript_3209/g.9317 Transcript_3209/m.9317 type:complete len:364 (-) Transcript_3209:3058-4149(-)
MVPGRQEAAQALGEPHSGVSPHHHPLVLALHRPVGQHRQHGGPEVGGVGGLLLRVVRVLNPNFVVLQGFCGLCCVQRFTRIFAAAGNNSSAALSPVPAGFDESGAGGGGVEGEDQVVLHGGGPLLRSLRRLGGRQIGAAASRQLRHSAGRGQVAGGTTVVVVPLGELEQRGAQSLQQLAVGLVEIHHCQLVGGKIGRLRRLGMTRDYAWYPRQLGQAPGVAVAGGLGGQLGIFPLSHHVLQLPQIGVADASEQALALPPAPPAVKVLVLHHVQGGGRPEVPPLQSIHQLKGPLHHRPRVRAADAGPPHAAHKDCVAALIPPLSVDVASPVPSAGIMHALLKLVCARHLLCCSHTDGHPCAAVF